MLLISSNFLRIGCAGAGVAGGHHTARHVDHHGQHTEVLATRRLHQGQHTVHTQLTLHTHQTVHTEHNRHLHTRHTELTHRTVHTHRTMHTCHTVHTRRTVQR